LYSFREKAVLGWKLENTQFKEP